MMCEFICSVLHEGRGGARCCCLLLLLAAAACCCCLLLLAKRARKMTETGTSACQRNAENQDCDM